MEMNYYKKGIQFLRLGSAALVALLFFSGTSAFGQLSGTYSIDKNSAATATNFKSFTSAVQCLQGQTRSDGGPALGTGVSNSVIFNVTAGSGPYTEQIILPQFTGVTASKTITINGNGQTIQFNGTTTNPSVIKFDGADYVRINNLTIKPTNATYTWGVWMRNASDYNTIEACKIDVTASTSTTAYYSAGVAMVNAALSFTGYSTGGIKGQNNLIKDNEIYGSASNNGMYAGIAINGTSTPVNDNNIIQGNYIHNFYIYGVFSYYYSGNIVYRGNRITRGTKPTLTTFYGIYNYYCPAAKYYDNYIADECPNNTATYSAYAIYDLYGTSTGIGVSEYINNTINLNAGYYRFGIYGVQYYTTAKRFLHNTIYMRAAQGYGYGIYAYDYSYINTEIKNNIIDAEFTSYASTFYNIYSYSYGTLGCNGNVMPRPNNSSHYTGYAYSLSAGGGASLSFSDWQSNTNTPDAQGTSVKPAYVSVAIGNFTPTTIDIDGSGVVSGVAFDQKGNARSATNPDPGAIEFDIPINVSVITFPGVICQGSVDNVVVTITNNSNLNLSDFYVNYEINGILKQSVLFSGTINAGASANHTFSTAVSSNVTGNFTLKAFVRGKTPVVNKAYTVNPAPVGSFVSKGAVFTGAFNSGDIIDPDIVAYGDNIRHAIEPPTGYTNAQFGLDWTFNSWEMITPNGTSPGAQYSKTNPNGGNNAFNSFTPVIGQSDSTFLIRYAIRSLTNGCIAPTVTRRIFVAPRPVATFTAGSSCEGDALQFTNNSTLSSGSVAYTWNFGDGKSSVLINPSHVYSGAANYTVTLKATSNYGYSHVATYSVAVNKNPTAEFGYVNVCQGAITPFTDGSLIPGGSPAYEWDFGDGSAKGAGNNPTHQYTTPGVYTVTMKVTSAGCSDIATEYVSYAPRAVVDFAPSVAICNNKAVSFVNSSSLVSGQMGYSWSFGENNATSTQINPNYKYMGFGTFDVTLTATTSFGCVNSKTKQVSLIQAPKANFTNTSLCNAEQVAFTNSSVEPSGANTTYGWAFSDGSNYGIKDVTRGFPSIGAYTVTLTALSDNGCADVFTKTISIDESPKADFYLDDVCEGSDIQIMNATTGNNGNIAYQWNLGAAGTSTLKNPIIIKPVVGTYQIEMTATTPGGCIANVIKTVNVKVNPTMSGLVISSGSKGDGTYIISMNGVVPVNANYMIFWGDGTRSNGKANSGSVNEIYTYMFDGKYDIRVRLENTTCGLEAKGSASVNRTGILSKTEGVLNAYPNPGNGVFNLDLSALNSTDTRIEVYAANGQLINGNVTLNGTTAQLDLSTAAAGVYIVKVNSNTEVYTTRITLNK